MKEIVNGLERVNAIVSGYAKRNVKERKRTIERSIAIIEEREIIIAANTIGEIENVSNTEVLTEKGVLTRKGVLIGREVFTKREVLVEKEVQNAREVRTVKKNVTAGILVGIESTNINGTNTVDEY